MQPVAPRSQSRGREGASGLPAQPTAERTPRREAVGSRDPTRPTVSRPRRGYTTSNGTGTPAAASGSGALAGAGGRQRAVPQSLVGLGKPQAEPYPKPKVRNYDKIDTTRVRMYLTPRKFDKQKAKSHTEDDMQRLTERHITSG